MSRELIINISKAKQGFEVTLLHFTNRRKTKVETLYIKSVISRGGTLVKTRSSETIMKVYEYLKSLISDKKVTLSVIGETKFLWKEIMRVELLTSYSRKTSVPSHLLNFLRNVTSLSLMVRKMLHIHMRDFKEFLVKEIQKRVHSKNVLITEEMIIYQIYKTYVIHLPDFLFRGYRLTA